MTTILLNENATAAPDVKKYRVFIHEAEEGGYWGEVLELPGCVSQGETLDELRDNIIEAINTILEVESQELSDIIIEFYEDAAPRTWTA